MQITLDSTAMRICDRYTCEKITPSRELMKKAGDGAYQHIKELDGSFAVVCGRGNNAGDGYVIAQRLFEDSKKVKLFLVENAFSADGQYYFDICKKSGIPFELCSENTDFSDFGNIIDCIYGTGFHGSVKGIAADVIKKINASGAFVVSIDINSGLSSDSGLSKLCVHSDLTVAIGFYKHGHFLGRAKDVMKKKVCIDIGIPLLPDVEKASLVGSSDFISVLKERSYFCHKGDFGYVTVLGGCTMYSGAVKLANLSLSALRSGCGVARVACPESLSGAVLPYLLESTFYPLKDENGFALFDKDAIDALLTSSAAIAVGMGWGDGPYNEQILTYILENGNLPLLIDADGINTLAKCDLSILKKTKCSVILTPHPKEFSRLCKNSVGEILEHPVKTAKEFAREHGVILLLKGSATVISDGKETHISDTGTPGMASAGSGDVLSGVILGLLGYNEPSLLTVSCGAYLCGLAGMFAQEESNSISAIASDTVHNIAKAVTAIMK